MGFKFASKQKKDLELKISKSLKLLVGMIGFEPTTPCPPDKCATKLRYIPTCAVYLPFVENAVNIIR